MFWRTSGKETIQQITKYLKISNEFHSFGLRFHTPLEGSDCANLLIDLCEAVASKSLVKIVEIGAIEMNLFDECFRRIEEIFSNNYSLEKIVIVTAAELGEREEIQHFSWITNRNKYYRKEKRFKKVKSAAP